MKITIPDNAALAALELAKARKQAAIDQTLDEIETLQESHTYAVAHLDRLREEMDQLTTGIRVLS